MKMLLCCIGVYGNDHREVDIETTVVRLCCLMFGGEDSCHDHFV